MDNQTLISFLLTFIAGVSTMIGTIFIFFNIKKVEEFITISLAFSLTIMILISIFDLIPSSSITIFNTYGILYGFFIVLLTFMLGYLSIDIINSKVNTNKSSLYRIGILSMLSLILHNLPEGIAVFMSTYSDLSLGIKLCVAIMLHNIPEGIAISIPLYFSGMSRGRVLFYTLIAGLSELLGAFLTFVFFKKFINDIFLAFILVFVGGLMISLSINDIFKEIKNYNKSKFILIGGIISFILFLIISAI